MKPYYSPSSRCCIQCCKNADTLPRSCIPSGFLFAASRLHQPSPFLPHSQLHHHTRGGREEAALPRRRSSIRVVAIRPRADAEEARAGGDARRP
jgi:hypothetical protein